MSFSQFVNGFGVLNATKKYLENNVKLE